MGSVDYSASVVAAANSAGVDPALALAVMNQESGGNPNAVSSAGAVGLFQLMPSSFPGVNINDPITNIDTGVAYLAQLLNRFGGNTADALAAYNWGPTAMSNYLAGNGSTMPSETQNYVSNILAAIGGGPSPSEDITDSGDGSVGDFVNNVASSIGVDPTTFVVGGVVAIGVLALLMVK